MRLRLTHIRRNGPKLRVNAPVEALPLFEWRRLFDVNLFGHLAMMQALLPTLVESRGTIVNISSVGGKIAMATYGPYASSKFALEAVSDALRREVELLGVKVIVIEPGAVTTEMLRQVAVSGERIISAMTDELRGRYATLMRSIISQAQAAILKRLFLKERLPKRQPELSRTRSPARGLVPATPLVAMRRSSSVSPGSSRTGCSTPFSPAVSRHTSPKLHRHPEFRVS